MALRVNSAAEEAFRQLLGNLRSVRENTGLSQDALTSRLLVRRGTVFEWEKGTARPTMRNLLLWSRELGLRLVLIGPDGKVRQASSKRIIGEAPEARELRSMAVPLKKLRVDRKLSLVKASRVIGVDRNSLLRWESARVTPRPMALIVWAQTLDCSVALRPANRVRQVRGSGTQRRAADDAAR